MVWVKVCVKVKVGCRPEASLPVLLIKNSHPILAYLIKGVRIKFKSHLFMVRQKRLWKRAKLKLTCNAFSPTEDTLLHI